MQTSSLGLTRTHSTAPTIRQSDANQCRTQPLSVALVRWTRWRDCAVFSLHWSLVTRHSHWHLPLSQVFYLCRSLVFAARRDLSSHLRSSCLLAFVWEKPDSRELRNVQRDSRCLVAPVAVLVVSGRIIWILEWWGCVSRRFPRNGTLS